MKGMKVSDPPIVIEEQFNCSPETVWRAITVHSEMVRWFFENIPEFDPKVGFETRFDVRSEDRIFPHVWKLLEVDPSRKITYSWRHGGYDGDSVMSMEIFEQENGTRFRLTHTILEDFPDGIPEFKYESGVAGWTYFIKERLKGYLEN